jgi:beta-lactam-binding protein with PASTA domain
VPNVKGKSLAAAKDAIAPDHCATGKIRRKFSSGVKAGRVISQRPAGGASLPRGGASTSSSAVADSDRGGADPSASGL